MLFAAWVAASLVLFVWSPWATSRPRRADAVIVLSGGLNGRLDPALALMRQRIAPLLVVSGAFHGTHWKKARKLCRGGYGTLRYRVLCFEPKPYSTQGEAEAIERLARSHRWTRIVVVTSRFHVTRARMLIRRCYDGGLAMFATHIPWWLYFNEIPSEWSKLIVQLTYQRAC